MTKKHRKSKGHKIEIREKRKLEKQQLWFIDANIFFEAILDENSKWFNFLMQFKVAQKGAITSTHAIGEVLKNLYDLKHNYSKYDIEKGVLAFNKILEGIEILIVNLSDKTFELIKNVVEYDSRVKFKDAVHIALAYEYYCVCFCSIDSGISVQTLRNFELKKIDKC